MEAEPQNMSSMGMDWQGAGVEDDLSPESLASGMKAATLFVILWLPILYSLEAAAGSGYEAGQPLIVDVLFIDRGITVGSGYDRMIAADPSIDVLGVPMPSHYSIGNLGIKAEQTNRLLRMYMPRTYEQLVDEHDMVILHEAPCGCPQFPGVYFDVKWIFWFVKAVEERGMPLSMWGGDASWGGGWEGPAYYESWGNTVLEPVLPFKCLEGTNPPRAAFQKPHFIDPTHPLARLPWKNAGPVELLNKVEPKIGCKVVAKAVGHGEEYPWIGWWRYGKAKIVGETQIFGSKGTTNRMLREWEWFQDFLIYLVYFGADKPIPEDIYRAHRIRVEINTHLAKASMLVSLLEFIEKFGASTVRLYEDLDEINRREKVAEEYYRRDDYDSAAQVFEEIHRSWAELNQKAIEAKEKALVWVYVIEWLSVTGTALLSGVLLWALMVRRKLYREIATTRIS